MQTIKDVFDQFDGMLEESNLTLEPKVEERMSHHIEDCLLNLLGNIEECESPIEKLFAMELDRVTKRSELNFVADIFYWSPQYEITLFEGFEKEKKYRVDFMVEFLIEKGGINYMFAIECDGHEFHEKTKEQASRDKQRDRDLMENGITVIRFTGSEIYENPFGCAMQAIKIIENYIRRIYRLQ